MKTPCKITLIVFLMSLMLPFGARAELSGELVKIADDTSVYLVKDSEKHVFPHEAIYLSWGYPADYSTTQTILEETLDSYTLGDPVPFRTGYMFRGTSASLFGKEAEAVFIADGDEIRPIFSADVYQTLFNDPDWNLVGWIPDDFLSKFDFELGETVLADNLHPDGILLEYNEYPEVRYLVSDGERRMISDEAFILNGFDEDRVVKQAYLEYDYADGDDLDAQEAVWAEPFSAVVVVEPEPDPEPEPEEPEDLTVYSSYSQKHISKIEYPEDWERSTYFNAVDNRHEIYFENQVADGAFGATFKASVAVVFEGSINSPSSMEDYKKVLNRITFLDSIIYNDLATESQGDTVVNDLGLTEKMVEFKVEKSSRKIKQAVYDFISDEEEIYMVMSALDDNWSDYELIFDHIYSSFVPEADQGFSDIDDLEVYAWGFTDGSNIVNGGIVTPYVDIKNAGDTAINLENTAKCKLTVTFPDADITTQEYYIDGESSFLPGGSLRMEFYKMTLGAAGGYDFKIQANSTLSLDELSMDNNFNDDREITVE